MADTSTFLGLDPRASGLPDSLASDIELIDQLLGRLLKTEGEEAVIRIAMRLYEQCADPSSGREPVDSAKTTDDILKEFPALNDPGTVSSVLRAFTILFQLVNAAEQKEIVHANRKRQSVRHKEGAAQWRPESIGE